MTPYLRYRDGLVLRRGEVDDRLTRHAHAIMARTPYGATVALALSVYGVTPEQAEAMAGEGWGGEHAVAASRACARGMRA